MTSSEDPNDESEDPSKESEDPDGESEETNQDSSDSADERPPRARTPEEIEELQRNASAGAVRFRNGESVEDEDIIEGAIRGSRERSSSSDED